MTNTIFYSWQADTPNKVGRSFLKEILGEVCVSMASDATLDEALRDVAVDSDTHQGVAGQPPIADTIFKKIDTAGVFVADMTFTSKRMDGRLAPNPNVLIEYGWALKSLTNERVICVMNTAYGEPSYESLPFDLAHLRWPIRYNLPIDAPSNVKTKEKKKLADTLRNAIRLSLDTISMSSVASLQSFPMIHAKDGPARFRGPNESIGFQDDSFGEDSKEIFLTPGSAMWLRIMPATNPQKEWPTRELKKIAMQKSSLLMPLIHPSGGYSYLRASDGEGMYRAKGNNNSNTNALTVDSVTFAFKTGEVWSIETSLLNYAKDRIYMTDTEKVFVDGIGLYSQFLKELGVNPPYLWKAGLVGVKGRQLGYAPPPGKQWIRDKGPVCATDIIEAEGKIDPEQSATTALLPFFKKIFDECGIERPDYLPQ